MMNDRKLYGLICFFFIIFTTIKILTRFYVSSPHYLNSDEMVYLLMMENPFKYQISNQFHYQLLYPVVLSVFRDANPVINFSIARIANAVLSTSIIFPVFYLSKRFLRGELALAISILAVLSPISFHFSYHVMAENLFLPLAIWCVYLIVTKERPFLTGISLFLLCMTKISGMSLVLGYIIFIFIKWIQGNDVRIHLRAVTVSGVLLSVYFLIQALLFGMTENAIIGYNLSTPVSSITFATFCSILAGHIGIIALTTCGVSLSTFLPLVKKFRELDAEFRDFLLYITITSVLILVVSSSFIAAENRLISRYVSILMPCYLIMIFYSYNLNQNKIFIIVSTVVFFIISIFIIKNASPHSELEPVFFFINDWNRHLKTLSIFLFAIFSEFSLATYFNVRTKNWILFAILATVFILSTIYITRVDHIADCSTLHWLERYQTLKSGFY